MIFRKNKSIKHLILIECTFIIVGYTCLTERLRQWHRGPYDYIPLRCERQKLFTNNRIPKADWVIDFKYFRSFSSLQFCWKIQ